MGLSEKTSVFRESQDVVVFNLQVDATVAVLGGDNLEPDLDPDGTAAAISSFLEQVEV